MEGGAHSSSARWVLTFSRRSQKVQRRDGAAAAAAAAATPVVHDWGATAADDLLPALLQPEEVRATPEDTQHVRGGRRGRGGVS